MSCENLENLQYTEVTFGTEEFSTLRFYSADTFKVSPIQDHEVVITFCNKGFITIIALPGNQYLVFGRNLKSRFLIAKTENNNIEYLVSFSDLIDSNIEISTY